MTRKLILHIGHPKTGTTSLQKTLQAWRPMLAEHGILHPDTGPHHNHKVLLPYLLSSGDPDRSDPHMAEAEQGWDAMMAQIEAQDPHTIILSSEQFFRLKSDAEMAAMTASLKRLASDAVIVAYLREPSALSLSAAQQQIKSSPDFRIREGDLFRRALEPFQMSGLGRMNVQVFARDKLKNGNIVHDFFARNLPELEIEHLPQPTSSNTSMSAEAMSLLQDIHRGHKKFRIGSPRREVAAADQQLDGFSRPRMHARVRSAIQAQCTDLDWLKEQFDVEFSDIDTASLARDEAERIIAGLDRIEDLCPVDADRKAALWSKLNRIDAMFGRFRRRF